MIYLVAPLFNSRERAFNERLKRLMPFPTYLPQEDGKLISDLLERGSSVDAASREIYQNDIRALHESKVLVAVLDGAHVDSGVAFEVGYFCALGKPIVGLHTDMRSELPFGHNPMLMGALDVLVHRDDEIVPALKTILTKLNLG